VATKTFYSTASGGACTKAAFCSGRTMSATGGNNATSETAGDLAATSHNLGSSETLFVWKEYECGPAVATWASGTYGVTVDVTVANMNLTLDEIHLCRVNSSCAAVSTIGSLTGIARNLGTTGAVTHNVTGSSDTHGSTDKLMVLLVCTNGAMSNQAATLQTTIATPIEDVVAAVAARQPYIVRQAVTRAANW
jgi:hypothetical protein